MISYKCSKILFDRETEWVLFFCELVALFSDLGLIFLKSKSKRIQISFRASQRNALYQNECISLLEMNIGYVQNTWFTNQIKALWRMMVFLCNPNQPRNQNCCMWVALVFCSLSWQWRRKRKTLGKVYTCLETSADGKVSGSRKSPCCNVTFSSWRVCSGYSHIYNHEA